MADEANESNRPNRRTNMDLNLYLGLPRSPRRARPDLGSDLALSSIPMNSSSSSSVASIEDSNTPANGSSSIPIETAESHPPYSPTTPAMDPNPQMDRTPPSPEYTPYFPSYESFNTSYPPLVDPNPLPPVHELDEATNPSLMIVDDPTALSGETHVPYSPPYVAPPPLPPVPPTPLAYMPLSSAQDTPNEDISFSFYPQPPPPSPYITPTRVELLRPEIRFRRLIETSHRLRARRFRSSSSHGNGVQNQNVASASTVNAAMAEPQTGQDMAACAERTAETSARKDKVKMEPSLKEEEASDEESKEKAQSNGANFECNICFEMASEPVVTSCGHLFCWPCLYQWLHVHSDHRECPVCKGEVSDTSITPIYGRGNTGSDAERAKSTTPVGEDGVKIPPRPRGNRVESFRQQFRPVSRRFGEGIASSMRRLLDQQIRHGGPGSHRFDPNVDAAMQEMVDASHRRVLTRLRARRLQREEFNIRNNISNAEVMPHVMVDTPINRSPLMNPGSSSANPNPNPNSASFFRDGIDIWHRFSLYGLASTERLAALTADLGRVVGRFASMSTSNNNGASTSASPMDPSSSERPAGGAQVAAALAADQVSASSTMAVIQGDAGVGAGNSEGPASASDRPNSSAGSSRAQRRRVRGGGSGTAGASTSGGGGNGGSLDVDGGPAHHLRKRRRLN